MSTPQSVIAVKRFKREFSVLGPKTNTREFDKNKKCLKKIEKRLNFLSENSVFWGPKLISNYSRQLRIGEYYILYLWWGLRCLEAGVKPFWVRIVEAFAAVRQKEKR